MVVRHHIVLCVAFALRVSITMSENNSQYVVCQGAQNDICMCLDDIANCSARIPQLTSIPLDLPLNIRVLNISNNNIAAIDTAVFMLYKRLKQVYADNNNISRIYTQDNISKDLSHIKILSLKHNPRLCTCTNANFVDWMHKRQNSSVQLSKPCLQMPPCSNKSTPANKAPRPTAKYVGRNRQRCMKCGADFSQSTSQEATRVLTKAEITKITLTSADGHVQNLNVGQSFDLTAAVEYKFRTRFKQQTNLRLVVFSGDVDWSFSKKALLCSDKKCRNKFEILVDFNTTSQSGLDIADFKATEYSHTIEFPPSLCYGVEFTGQFVGNTRTSAINFHGIKNSYDTGSCEDRKCKKTDTCSSTQRCATVIYANSLHQLSISKGCLNAERCQQKCDGFGRPDTNCILCCMGNKCNEKIETTKYLDYLVEHRINLIGGKDKDNIFQALPILDCQIKIVKDVKRQRNDTIMNGRNVNLHPATVHTLLNVSTDDVLNSLNSERLIAEIKRNMGLTDSATINFVSDEYCSEHVYRSDKIGIIKWQKTVKGKLARRECPRKQGAYASNECNLYGFGWMSPNVTTCDADSSEEALQLENIVNEEILTPKAAQKNAKVLNKVTRRAAKFSTYELSLSVQAIDNILNVEDALQSNETVDALMNSFDSLMEVNDSVLSNNSDSKIAALGYIHSITEFTKAMPMSEPILQLSKRKVSIGLCEFSLDKGRLKYQSVQTVAFEIFDNANVLSAEIHTDSRKRFPRGNVSVAIKLPNAVMENATNERVIFTALSSSKFFQTSSANKTRTNVISKVISGAINNKLIKDLTEPVQIVTSVKTLPSRPLCVFWNFDTSQWSTDGCKFIISTNTSITCHCYHLTNFAVIMDVYDSAGTLPEAFTWISLVGCVISMVCLAATILIYIYFRVLLKEEISRILLCLCGSLLIANGIFLISLEYKSDNAWCKVIAALLHFWFFSVMCWSLIKSYHMYLTLIQVLNNSYKSYFMRKSAAFAFGVPAVAVCITIAIDRENYGFHDVCWLARVPFFAAFLGPVLLILLLNIVILCMIVRQLHASESNPSRVKNNQSQKSYLRGIIGLVLLLNLTWLFALFSIQKAGVVFNAVFAIVNSLQGLFIFILFVLLKPDVIKQFKKRLMNVSSHESGSRTPRKPGSSGTASVDKDKQFHAGQSALNRASASTIVSPDGYDNPVNLKDEDNSRRSPAPFLQKNKYCMATADGHHSHGTEDVPGATSNHSDVTKQNVRVISVTDIQLTPASSFKTN